MADVHDKATRSYNMGVFMEKHRAVTDKKTLFSSDITA